MLVGCHTNMLETLTWAHLVISSTVSGNNKPNLSVYICVYLRKINVIKMIRTIIIDLKSI